MARGVKSKTVSKKTAKERAADILLQAAVDEVVRLIRNGEVEVIAVDGGRILNKWLVWNHQAGVQVLEDAVRSANLLMGDRVSYDDRRK